MDQLKRKAENTDREFEKFKKQQQEEYNKLHEHIMLLSTDNSLVDVVNMWFVCCFDVKFWWLDM